MQDMWRMAFTTATMHDKYYRSKGTNMLFMCEK